MIERCNHSNAILCGSCAQKNNTESTIDQLRAEVERLKPFESFTNDLRDECNGFSKDVNTGTDLFAAHDGFYVLYDDVIKACGGGSYSNDPLELIGGLLNRIDQTEASLTKTVKALEVIKANSLNPAHTMTMLGLESVVDTNYKLSEQTLSDIKGEPCKK